MLDAYIYDGTRTPFGRNAGSLSKVRPDDLLAGAIKAVVKRSAFKPTDIEDVNVGCANQAGEDSRCLGRHAALLAGLPIEVAGNTIQRNCGSGMN
ncbi:MAG: 3-oxoadipyl-CoA thiolase, partial [Rhodospirillaceae bacterium]